MHIEYPDTWPRDTIHFAQLPVITENLPEKHITNIDSL